WHNYPTELDSPYHLLMGKMFADHGRVVLWDSYEFAPVGRPHLYPPLLHILVWLIHVLVPTTFMNIGRIIVTFQSLMGLFFVWFFAKRFFSASVAFLALVFYASSTESWWWQTSVSPIALITVLFLPFVYLFYKKRVAACILILSACFYLHYGLSFTLVLTTFLATLCCAQYRKAYLKNFFVITLSSVLLFLPWLVHLHRHRDYFFHHAKGLGNLKMLSLEIYWPEILINFNIVLWFFCIIGFVFCLKKIKEDFKYSLLASAFLAYFVFLFLFEAARFNSHSALVYSVLGGLGAVLAWEWIRRAQMFSVRLILKSYFIFVIALSLFFEFHYLPLESFLKDKKTKAYIGFMDMPVREIFIRPTPLLNEIRAFATGTPLLGKHRIRIQAFFTSPIARQLLAYVRKHVDPQSILHMDNPALADYITLVLGIKTDTGMYWEAVTPEMMQAIEKIRTSGYYISTTSDFRYLVPRAYARAKKFPPVIESIGVFNIGYWP
ncbi:MAG: hypothetical protein V1863_05310, partial [Candidatus Omnitrophota bacterium]